MAQKNKEMMKFILLFGIITLFSILPMVSALNWTSDLNTGLKAYWDFESVDANNQALDLLGVYNVTLDNSTIIGKVGNAYSGLATETLGDTGLIFNKGTINFWAKREPLQSGGFAFTNYNALADVDGAIAFMWNWGVDSYGWSVGVGTGNSGTPNLYEELGSIHNVENNVWYMFTIVINDTYVGVYENGTLTNYYDITDRNITYDGTLWFLSQFGNYPSALDLDEFGVWENVILNDSQILQLFNDGNGMTYFPSEIPEEPEPEPILPSGFSTSGQAIYEIMDSSGAGLGIFLQFMGQALPILLIGLLLIGIVIAIAYSIISSIKIKPLGVR